MATSPTDAPTHYPTMFTFVITDAPTVAPSGLGGVIIVILMGLAVVAGAVVWWWQNQGKEGASAVAPIGGGGPQGQRRASVAHARRASIANAAAANAAVAGTGGAVPQHGQAWVLGPDGQYTYRDYDVLGRAGEGDQVTLKYKGSMNAHQLGWHIRNTGAAGTAGAAGAAGATAAAPTQQHGRAWVAGADGTYQYREFDVVGEGDGGEKDIRYKGSTLPRHLQWLDDDRGDEGSEFQAELESVGTEHRHGSRRHSHGHGKHKHHGKKKKKRQHHHRRKKKPKHRLSNTLGSMPRLKAALAAKRRAEGLEVDDSSFSIRKGRRKGSRRGGGGRGAEHASLMCDACGTPYSLSDGMAFCGECGAHRRPASMITAPSSRSRNSRRLMQSAVHRLSMLRSLDPHRHGGQAWVMGPDGEYVQREYEVVHRDGAGDAELRFAGSRAVRVVRAAPGERWSHLARSTRSGGTMRGLA